MILLLIFINPINPINQQTTDKSTNQTMQHSSMKNPIERELNDLIWKAKQLIHIDINDNNKNFTKDYDWIEQNIQETAKLLKQIETLQQKNMAIIIHSYMSIIDTKLFNESRDCCEQLQNWSKLLLEHRKRLQNDDQMS